MATKLYVWLRAAMHPSSADVTPLRGVAEDVANGLRCFHFTMDHDVCRSSSTFTPHWPG